MHLEVEFINIKSPSDSLLTRVISLSVEPINRALLTSSVKVRERSYGLRPLR